MSTYLATSPEAGWQPRLLGGYLQKWVILGVLIGLVAGAGAIVFFEAISEATKLLLGHLAGLNPPMPREEGDTATSHIGRRWAIPLVLVLGGLISGIIVFWLAPEAEGHGTDARDRSLPRAWRKDKADNPAG